MRTRRRKRKNKTRRKRTGGGIFTYPMFYMQKIGSFFTVDPPDAYGNNTRVVPFPQNQSK